MLKIVPLLENWSTIVDPRDSHLPPELARIKLHGNIHHDERFENGTPVTTSSIQELDIKERWARTRNTVYQLGKPSIEFIEWLTSQGKTLEDYEKVLDKS